VIHHTAAQLRAASQCETFAALVELGMSMRCAARKTGRPLSFFSGENSPYARYTRVGLKALKGARR